MPLLFGLGVVLSDGIKKKWNADMTSIRKLKRIKNAKNETHFVKTMIATQFWLPLEKRIGLTGLCKLSAKLKRHRAEYERQWAELDEVFKGMGGNSVLGSICNIRYINSGSTFVSACHDEVQSLESCIHTINGLEGYWRMS